MTWEAHHVVFRLCSPMHIGQAKIGNVQRTRPYVTGRVLWGAFTQCITRQSLGETSESHQYLETGKAIHDTMAFSYFYPTTDPDGAISLWPWPREGDFRSKFISTYASTALSYPYQSADEGMLHEVEFISPRTLDVGAQVYLSGYIFARKDETPRWQSVLDRLQLGGERGYGWGRVRPEPSKSSVIKNVANDVELGHFGKYTVQCNKWPPVITAADGAYLIAHTLVSGFENEIIESYIEPLVGRETTNSGQFGHKLSKAQICFAPGGKVRDSIQAQIGQFGVWRNPNASPTL